jgi:hypothetical protein
VADPQKSLETTLRNIEEKTGKSLEQLSRVVRESGLTKHGETRSIRPIHDKVLAQLQRLGAFEAAPKKGYVSYRRKKQFVMVGPKTNAAVEIGLGAKSLPKHARLKEMPPNSMSPYTTRVGSPDEIDGLVEGWIAKSYAEAR